MPLMQRRQSMTGGLALWGAFGLQEQAPVWQRH
jgi:hypothetical protein